MLDIFHITQNVLPIIGEGKRMSFFFLDTVIYYMNRNTTYLIIISLHYLDNTLSKPH